MLQRDYIIRQIQQAMQVLAQVVFKKQQGDYEDALQYVQHAGQLMLGRPLSTFQTLPYDAFVAPLYADSRLDVERGAIVAELLRQQGDLYTRMGDRPQANASQRQALRLYLEVYLAGGQHQSPDTVARIDQLLEHVASQHLSAETERLLFRFYEHQGRFADAETMLFHLADREADEALYLAGMAFYRRLRKLPPETLAAGHLPWEEISEGTRAFRQRFGR